MVSTKYQDVECNQESVFSPKNAKTHEMLCNRWKRLVLMLIEKI